ncbi:MAG: type IV pilin N-terminal domain-containing protein [Methanoregula sp.]
MKTDVKQVPATCAITWDRICESAVSPVVGVMLMLVVTIIIAAVVSGFAGGLIGTGDQKTPTLNMDVTITNSGTWRSSEFLATVTGVSEPIPTKDLKLVTSWTTTVKTNTYTGGEHSSPPFKEIAGTGCILSQELGTVYHGGAEVTPGVYNTRTTRTYTGVGGVAPFGSGVGVDG